MRSFLKNIIKAPAKLSGIVQFKDQTIIENFDKQSVEKNNDFKNPISIIRNGTETQFQTKLKISENDRPFLCEAFQGYGDALDYIQKLLNDNPGISLKELRKEVDLFLELSGYSIIAITPLYKEMYNLHTRINAGFMMPKLKRHTLTYKETSTRNKRFTLLHSRRKIYFEEIGIALSMEHYMPMLPPNRDFYLKITANNYNSLGNLRLHINYKTSANEEAKLALLEEGNQWQE